MVNTKKSFSILFVLMVLLVPACKRKAPLKSDKTVVKTTREYVNIPLEDSDSQEEAIQADNLDDLFEENEETNQLVTFADDIAADQEIDWTDIEDSTLIKTILFDFDKNNIRADQTENIAYDAALIKEQVAQREEAGDNVEILVEGHTCTIGTAKHNKVLSLNRAKAVEQQLVNLGVTPEKIKIVGRGSIAPVVVNGKPLTGNNRDELAPNRRVEVKLINA
jgi:outer membrane protein OmpA-like peptidoglycan-associated protein